MIRQRKILFMDDVEEDMEPLSELLEEEGFKVLKALTIEDAEEILANDWVHMMIVDLNMKGDDDSDRSGLKVVNNPNYAAVPKVILTGYPEDPKVLRQMIPTADERRLVIGFLGKNDGDIHNKLIKLFNTLSINWDLQILWASQPLGSLISLAGLIIPEQERILLAQRVDELEDLLRRLFLDSEQMIVGRLFTYQIGVAWIEIITQAKGAIPKSYIVVCGQKQAIKQQVDHYNRLPYNTIRHIKTVETLRFAATAYECVSSNLIELASLQDCYLRWPSEATEKIIDYLFSSTLTSWHGQHSSIHHIKNLIQLYQACSPKQSLNHKLEEWQRNIENLCHKASTIGGLSRLSYSFEQLTLYTAGQVNTYPNPVHFLLTEGVLLNTPFLQGTVHGALDLRNILVDFQQHAWPIDFSQIQEGPILLDFVALELAFKAELLLMVSMEEWCIIEKKLLEVKSLTGQIALDDHSPEVQKILKMVSVIRKHVAIAVDQSLQRYLAVLFVYSIEQISVYGKDKSYTCRELAAYMYYLISAAMICDHLTAPREFVPNFMDRFVLVEGEKRLKLTPREWDLLKFMYNRVGQPCGYKEILKEVYQDPLSDIENTAWIISSGRPKVNAAIGRLREKLEPDAENPKYILTEREYGYKLEI